MRQQVRFASLGESWSTRYSGLLFNKTNLMMLRDRFYNYARLAGQRKKIQAKL